MIFLSIVVPIYNVEKFLPDCLNSILSSERLDIEVILVDDGSTDKCPEICDNYAINDKRVRVIHQKNAGLSAARNTGTLNSHGLYTTYVDSDDWIDSSVFDEFYGFTKNSQNEIDLVFLEMILCYPGNVQKSLGEGYVSSEINGKSKTDVISHIAHLPKYQCTATAKFIRTKLMTENNIFFEDNLLCEDNDWNISILGVSNYFGYIDKPFYYYRLNRPGSILTEKQSKLLNDRMYIVEKHGKIETTCSDFQKDINSILAFQFVSTLYLYATYKFPVRKLYSKRIKNMMWLLDFGNGLSYKIAKIIYKIFGLYITASVIRFYRWISNPFYQRKK